VIAAPPFEAGAVHDTLAWVLPARAETLSGADDVVAGVTGAEATDGVLVPTLLAAVTVKV